MADTDHNALPADARRSVLDRLALPSGTVPVAAALVITAISAFLFFKVAGEHLGDAAFKPVSSLWFATFALAPGFFLPLEQELGRATAHRLSVGQGARPVAVRVMQLGALLTVGVVAVLVIFAGRLADEFFDGESLMVVWLIIGFVGYGAAHLARGICSGHGRFTSYGLILGIDSALRIVGVGVLAWLIGTHSIEAFGALVGVSPLVGVLVVGARRELRSDPGPPATWAEVTPNLGWLLMGSVFAAMLVNAGPITTTLLAGDGQKPQVTAFSYAVLLGRIPLFMFQAVQASLLPRLASLAAAGRMAEFRSGLSRLLKLVVGVAVIGVVGSALVGPFLLDTIFHTEVEVGARTLTVLALGSACYMLALAMAQALIALHGHAHVAIGWTIGMGAFVGATAILGSDTFKRVELGLLCGSACAMAYFVVAMRSRLAHGATVDEGSALQAFADRPVE